MGFEAIRFSKKKYNTPETAVSNDEELLRVSNSISNSLIWCHQFEVSSKSLSSLKQQGNYVVGTGENV